MFENSRFWELGDPADIFFSEKFLSIMSPLETAADVKTPNTLNVEFLAIVRNISQNKAKIALKIDEKPSYSGQAALKLSQSSVLSSVTTGESLGTI